MDKTLYETVEEFIQLASDTFDVKQELDGYISILLEDVFDDLVCIDSYCENGVVYFGIDEKHREITKQQLNEVENITNSKNFVDFNFMIESGWVFE